MNGMIKLALFSCGIRESLIQIDELQQRRKIFKQAREYADYIGKPLLVVGAPKFEFNHPCGDVTIDSSSPMAKFCNAKISDVRYIPYPNRYFGAVFCSHVLEHLSTIEEAIQALDEMERVAEKVFTVSPSKASLLAWLNPNHHLWVTPSGDGYIIEQRGKGQPREKSYTIALEVQ